MSEFSDKVFVIVADEITEVTVHSHISCKGVVTGYKIWSTTGGFMTFKKADIYVDEDAATKALFLKKLKADDEDRNLPAEDKKGERHWIKGHKRQSGFKSPWEF